MSFGHREAHYPRVVVEVCYTNKRQCVASHLADEYMYILDTAGSMNAVIAVDIDIDINQKFQKGLRYHVSTALPNNQWYQRVSSSQEQIQLL